MRRDDETPPVDRVRETMRERDEEIEESTEANEDLDEEPDYNPQDPELKRIKGG
jgi:hypothetical protein